MFATNNWICKSVSAANLIHILHGFDPRPVLRFRRSIRLFPIPLIYYLCFNGGLTIASVFLSLREPSEDEDVKEDVAEDEMV